jgi:transposase
VHSNPSQWRRIRQKLLLPGGSIRSVAKTEGMSRVTLRKILAFESPPGYGGRGIHEPKPSHPPPTTLVSRTETVRQRWMEWLYDLERTPSQCDQLVSALSGQSRQMRKRLLAVIALRRGFTIRAIARHLCMSRATIRTCSALFDTGGLDTLLGRKQRLRKADDESLKKALFSLLHEPPSLSGFNRTTWKLADLQRTLAVRGFPRERKRDTRGNSKGWVSLEISKGCSDQHRSGISRESPTRPDGPFAPR